MLCDKLVQPVRLAFVLTITLALNLFRYISLCDNQPLHLTENFKSCSDQITLVQQFSSFSCVNLLFRWGMRTDLILALYFFLIAIITLLLAATYLLAVFEQEKIIRNRTYGKRNQFGDNPILTSTSLN